MDRDPFARGCRANHDPLGDLVVCGDVNPALLTGVTERHQQAVSVVRLAQQHTGRPDRNEQPVPERRAAHTTHFGPWTTEAGLDCLHLLTGQWLQHDGGRRGGRLRSTNGQQCGRAAVGEQRHVLNYPVGPK